MFYLLSGTNRKLLAAAVILFPLVETHAALPSTQELIQELEKACKENEEATGEKSDWPLMSLANAKAYNGDHAGAVKIAQTLTGIWKGPTLQSCWQIHYEQTGAIAEFPADAFGESEIEKTFHATMRLEIAKALAKAGQLEKASEFLPKDEPNRLKAYVLADFHIFVAEDQIRLGDKNGAAASLERAWIVSEPFSKDEKRVEWLETMARLWLQLGNQEQAQKAVNAALHVVREKSTKAKITRLTAEAWGRIGSMRALLGNKKSSQEAFQEALRLEEVADQNEKNDPYSNLDMRVSVYMRSVGLIGTWQSAAGDKREAAETYGKAIAMARLVKEDKKRDFYLKQFVELQSEKGDVEEALKTVEQMKGAYWRALGYCRCAEQLIASGQVPAAQQLLEKAEVIADDETDLNNKTSMLEDIGKAKAKSGNVPAAKRCFEKALKASRSTKDNEYHQRIARSQIRVGLFEDAYTTITAMGQSPYRLLPLGELAREKAKQEASARKKPSEQ